MISINFTGVSSGFEVLPQGQYEGVIDNVEVKDTKAGDSQYISVSWKIIHEDKERKLFDNYSLKPQALWKLKSLLDAFGLNTEGQLELNPTDLIGQAAILDVIIEKYNNEDKNSVKKVSAV